MPDFAFEGWSNTERLLTHWLENSGTWCAVDPVDMMEAMPSFKQEVQNCFSGMGDGLFDSGWVNFSPGDNVESEDWYYAFNDFRYRVVALRMTGADGSLVSEYTVGVKKPYVFGDPRHAISHFGITMAQAELQHLHTTGLAQNFIAMGIAHQYGSLGGLLGRLPYWWPAGASSRPCVA
ncbi:MAG TPA: hypothetical protein VJ914_22430 [Pseudonocardiaceae bacterium]|nr:hypothetical protein [Pseudonocardiaceae bacterium]